MIKSMTGYGKASVETPQKKITVEIKSLNSKQLDINTRLPWILREKELEIRNIVGQKLERGKIDLIISYNIFEGEFLPVINRAAVKNYFSQLSEIAGELGINISDQILSVIMKFPETLNTEKTELPEEEWTLVRNLLDQSIDMLDKFRVEEGSALEKDIRNSINRIIESLSGIEEYEPGRIMKIREKLMALLEENIQPDKIDRNRFEQEIIYYLDKFDINEEKIRIKQHCYYFLETLSAETSNGKMLNFIAQEIGREINTIGAKANDASIQKLVVTMKDDLEKIKEQLLNVL
ncbi:MAG TPA: YicC family protein [Bacteroidales bacterium]|nr:YicC family protein [Bacteroidales bacterium]